MGSLAFWGAVGGAAKGHVDHTLINVDRENKSLDEARQQRLINMRHRQMSKMQRDQQRFDGQQRHLDRVNLLSAIGARGTEARKNIDTQGDQTLENIKATGTQNVRVVDATGVQARKNIDATGVQARKNIDKQGDRTEAQIELEGRIRERLKLLDISGSMMTQNAAQHAARFDFSLVEESSMTAGGFDISKRTEVRDRFFGTVFTQYGGMFLSPPTRPGVTWEDKAEMLANPEKHDLNIPDKDDLFRLMNDTTGEEAPYFLKTFGYYPVEYMYKMYHISKMVIPPLPEALPATR